MGFKSITLGTLTIATTAIGIQCLNKGTAEQKDSFNKKFLVFMLVLACLIVAFDLGYFIFQMTKKAETGGMA